MLNEGIILFVSLVYIGLLFGIAYVGDRLADEGKSLVSNPYIYALSLGVYCTAWTFYGSVGRAASTGPGFLTIYIGPTLMMALGWLVIRKIIRISKMHHITSIADFIASRYGKSSVLGGVVTIIAVLGIIPYISLQLKAVSTSFLIIKNYPVISTPANFSRLPFFTDTAFYVALVLAVFAILFGTRHLEATERHEGLVTAIAFESMVKLFAFLAIGFFITYGLYNGFTDINQKAHASPHLKELFTLGTSPGVYTNWTIYIIISMMAILFLPRQFQVTVVENVDEKQLEKAIWLFPLYLLAINIFVLPVAIAGFLHPALKGIDADTYVLALPMAENREILTTFIYIGGLSASTGMVIVETVALSTMICNDLVMPILLRLPFLNLSSRSDLSTLFLGIRRGSIILVLLFGYAYFHLIGEFYPLVSIGLVSFTAVAQFAPPILGGIFWKMGTKIGALCGLIAGFAIWCYTLVLPSLAQVGLISQSFIDNGPFGIPLLKPFQLFGLTGFDHAAHAAFWSLFANLAAYVGISLFTRPTALEHTQAALFVDVFKYSDKSEESSTWRGTVSIPDLRSLLIRFLGKERVDEALSDYAKKYDIVWDQSLRADPGLVWYAEKLLAGAIGSASARVMVASVVKEEPLGLEEVMGILDETRQVITYSRELEKKSAALERATTELKAANERLKELDKMKDEFISTVTHELRTPLTSIRSLAEILNDNPDLDKKRQKHFSTIIISETTRLARLINQVLDIQKIESGRMEWQMTRVDMGEIVREAVQTFDQVLNEKEVTLQLDLPGQCPYIHGDRDRLIQVMVNLVSNAIKFCNPKEGLIEISLQTKEDHMRVDIADNGIGIQPENREVIFSKFRQIKDASRGRPQGSGLGLAITRRIISRHGGRIWVDSVPGKGSTFTFTLPMSEYTWSVG